MVSSKQVKILHIFFGMVALIAGVINAISNIFYPCSLTLIPASIIYFLLGLQNDSIRQKPSFQIIMMTIGFGLSNAGYWELLILTSWNDLLHIFMVLTGLYFCVRMEHSKKSLLVGLIFGIIFILIIRVLFILEIFTLSLDLKIITLGELGSWLLSLIFTAISWLLILYLISRRSN